MITDVVSMGRTCHAMQSLCDRVARRRIRIILEPWTGTHFQPFLDLLGEGECVITGSCALAMLMGGDLPKCRDLNLVAPPASFSLIDNFLHHTMGYTMTRESCHRALARIVGSFRVYRRNGQVITLSLPKEGLHILHVILNAPSTVDMIYMTGGGLSCFYFKWLQEGVVVHGQSAPKVPWGDKLGHVGHDDHNWTVARHTQFLGGPCLDLCPTLWHHVASGKHQLFVDWDTTRTIRNVASDCDIEWRLNTTCFNDRCPYHITIMARNFEGCGASSGTSFAL
jgi:hypothetical protein